MKIISLFLVLLASHGLTDQLKCFESRNDIPLRIQTEKQEEKNTLCSPFTGGVLWWRNPFENTIPMIKPKVEGDYSNAEAVVKPRTEQLTLYAICGVACHNGTFPPVIENNTPRKLGMHTDLIPDALDFQHGKGAIWCLDCHHTTERKKLVDHFGNALEMNDSPTLCGSCHGQVYSDWRDGLHGKRIGEWASTGKKRWFVCTECHNPHDVEGGHRASGFNALSPEPAPLQMSK